MEDDGYYRSEELYAHLDNPRLMSPEPEIRIVQVDGIPHRLVMPASMWANVDIFNHIRPRTNEQRFEDIIRDCLEHGCNYHEQCIELMRLLVEDMIEEGVPPWDCVDLYPMTEEDTNRSRNYEEENLPD